MSGTGRDNGVGAARRAAAPARRRTASAVALALALLLATALVPSTAGAQTCLVWAGEIPLQQAVREHACVQVSAGTWVLDSYLILPAGRTLQGDPLVPRDQIVLKAGPGWVNTIGDGVVNDDLSGGAMAYVRHLTLDANGLATGGVGTRNMTVEDTIVQGARCWGVGIAGDNVVVRDNLIRRNGADPACTGPPGAGIYATTQLGGRPAFYAPVITGNRVTENTGPGVDVASVWLGTFSGNVVSGNTSWAGFSLFGSMWTITGNVIRHPATDQGQPYHRPCRGGPSGVHSAAIMVCQQDDVFNQVSVANSITDNRISSWYGILLIGNDEGRPYWAPRGNVLERNDAFGSFHGFADDFKPGQWFTDRNRWDGNPTYF